MSFDVVLRGPSGFDVELQSGAVGNATAPGVTLTTVNSFVPGSASGVSNATASGVTVTEALSFVPGSATGQRNATASGATVSAVYSLLPGAASAGVAATAGGATVSNVYSLIPGLADGSAVTGSGNRGDDAAPAPRIYYIRKAKRLKEELDRPAPLRKERKQRVIEIQEALEPVKAELADYAIKVDARQIEQSLAAFERSRLGYASLMAGLQEFMARAEAELQAAQHAQEQRRKRNRRIALAMLMAG